MRFTPHLQQQVEHPHRRGDEQHRPDQVGQPELEVARVFAEALAEHVADMDHADAVIQRIAVDRQAGMVLGLELLYQLVDADRRVDRDDVGPGHHYIDHGEIAEIEHVGEQHPFHRFDGRLVLVEILDQFLEGVADRRLAVAAPPERAPEPFPGPAALGAGAVGA